ncbi:MAG: CDP-alcohol phosphatidyltransferase family protein [Candidatus Omnitrophica bacterium]|nr:CDP-alcohol phosphatidyltransferase family protein [Candidatus Omnitrophota bacterium]MCM8825988.1 CDP-alcohol phosphatidyltransferase family protein [Candidatus Omnitrophota bacterium]
MSFADKLSIARIILIPFFVSLLIYSRYHSILRYFALGVFVVAVLSDFFDGLVARIKKEKSKFGKVIDPLADKLLLIISFISLYFLKFAIPLWVVIIIVSRDLIILLGVVVLNFLKIDITISPSIWGKLTTFFQMFTILIVLIEKELKLAPYTWSLAIFFTIVSGMGYIFRGIKTINLNTNQRL